MKLIRNSRLRYQKDKSDKVYEVDLVELTSGEPSRYLVNFRYGRKGSTLREGTKTRDPVTLEQAERLFDSVVVSKVNKGYQDQNALSSYTSLQPKQPSSGFDHNTLINRIEQESSPYELARQIWRLRPVANPEVAYLIANKLGSDTWQLEYAILWTLGRVGSEANIDAIKPYLSHQDVRLATIALESLISLSPKSERKRIYAELSGFELISVEEFVTQVDDFIAQRTAKGSINLLLKKAYLQSVFDEEMHQSLRDVLAKLPYAPNAFQGIRYILKMSEFRLDANMFAAAYYRLEQSNPYFQRAWRYHYSPEHGRLDIENELSSPESKLAHSQHTHNYLVRRQWRVLKQLGVNESPDFVRLATQLLLQFKDSDGKKPKTSEVYEYDQNWHRHVKAVNHYDEFARYSTLNALLRSENPRYKRSDAGYVWKLSSDVVFEGRGEAFAHLWDQVPHNLLELILGSQCEPVCDFAVRALQDNTSYSDALSGDILVGILVRPYTACQNFALPLLETYLKRHALSTECLITLLNSDVEVAQNLALEQLDKIRDLSKSVDVLAALLLMEKPSIHKWLEERMKRTALFRSAQSELLMSLVLTLTDPQSESNSIETFEHAEWLSEWLNLHCKDAISTLSLSQIELLILSQHSPNVLIGCEFLMAVDVEWAQIPATIFEVIENNRSHKIQSYSVALLSKQSAEELVDNLSYLLKLLLKNNPSQRQAVLKTLPATYQRGSQHRPLVFGKLVDLLHKRELDSDLQQMIIGFIRQEFERELSLNSLDEVMSLATATSTMAHDLAYDVFADSYNARQLERILTASQWYALAQSSTYALRALAIEHYVRTPATLLNANESPEEPEPVLTLLNSQWQDVQDFAFEFCRNQMTSEHWNPESIVAVCDNPDERVQAFGRELLQRFFDESEGKQYLLKLSQHPAANVELFVTQLLAQYAANDEGMLLALKPYFVSVLSRVNRGRVAKDRVLKFLTEQADCSALVTEMVSDILVRQSLTSVQKDKAQILKAMLHLKKTNTHLDMPIKVTSPPSVISKEGAISNEGNKSKESTSSNGGDSTPEKKATERES